MREDEHEKRQPAIDKKLGGTREIGAQAGQRACWKQRIKRACCVFVFSFFLLFFVLKGRRKAFFLPPLLPQTERLLSAHRPLR